MAVGDEVTVTVPHLHTPTVDVTFLLILPRQNQEETYFDSHDTFQHGRKTKTDTNHRYTHIIILKLTISPYKEDGKLVEGNQTLCHNVLNCQSSNVH